MKKRLLTLAASVVSTAALLAFAGCGGPSSEPSDEGLFPPGEAAVAGAALTPVDDSLGTVTVTGTVTIDGDVPPAPEIPAIRGNQDASVCLAGTPDEVTEPTWRVNPGNKGVANVVVWVKPPKDKYFKKPADDKKTWKDEVIVDQPHCAFVPHVTVLFQQYYDGANYSETGQKFTVLNSAPIPHNIRITGRDNRWGGGTLPAKSGRQEYSGLKTEKREVSMNCDIHKWMSGYLWTFDHPFAAVTDADGKFKLENVPAGSEITIQGWHE